MKSDRRAKQGKDAERPKSGKSALQIPDADRCNGTALRKANRRVSQLYDAVLAPCGLRSTQRSILTHIARVGRPSMGELASSLVLDRSARAKLAESTPLWERAQHCFEAVFGAKKAKVLRTSLKLLASTEFADAFQQIEVPGKKRNQA